MTTMAVPTTLRCFVRHHAENGVRVNLYVVNDDGPATRIGRFYTTRTAWERHLRGRFASDPATEIIDEPDTERTDP
jgi:hypothetical protein